MPRSEDGQIVGPDALGVYQLYNVHVASAEKNQNATVRIANFFITENFLKYLSRIYYSAKEFVKFLSFNFPSAKKKITFFSLDLYMHLRSSFKRKLGWLILRGLHI